MATDLFLAASGWPASAFEAVVPPSCWRGVDAAPGAAIEGPEAVLEFPEWSLRERASHFVPALSLLSDVDPSYRFEMQARAAGAWSPWIGGAAMGPASFAPIAASAPALAAEVDVFIAPAPVDRVRLRLRLRADRVAALLGSPWFVALSAWGGRAWDDRSDAAPRALGRVRLAVPAMSQMEEDAGIRHRICSPTSLAMVLAYWGERAQVAALAAELFHPALDLYGVWLAAIRAAGRRRVAGYLLRFPDWASAAWCLERGMPIIASVRYSAGELTGAAVEATPGHLLVLTGYEADAVLVNDPAAPVAAAVPRRYRFAELCRVWLARAGVGYVLFKPEASGAPRSTPIA